MPTAELTVQLPPEEIEFLRSYAQQNGTTVAELLARYVTALRRTPPPALHPDILKITGLVPADVDTGETYLERLVEKHR